MKTDPFTAAFDGFADVVETQMTRQAEEIRTLREQVRTLSAQVEELVSTRSAPVTVVGPPGPAGERGEKGDSGVAGPAGDRGSDGVPGIPGVAGPAGERGSDGAPSNVPGPQGERGADGAPSTVPGPQGERGSVGAPSTVPGPQGERGADGITTREEVIAIVHEEGAVVQSRNMADWYRDVYRADTAYTRGALVTYDGHLWLSKADSKAQQPGTSEAWKLITKAGRPGRDKT